MLHKLSQYILWYIIKFLVFTYKVKFVGEENRDHATEMSPNKSFLFSCWHEHVYQELCAHAWTRPYLILASRSKDGDYAAFVGNRLGYVTIRGSSRKKDKDKGGKEAIETYVKGLKEGINCGITVDGPKGPRRVCKPGIVIMAMRSKSLILPTIAVSSSYWEFNSWDKFKVPKPWATITIIYGTPIEVPETATPEEVDALCLRVAEAMEKSEADYRLANNA